MNASRLAADLVLIAHAAFIGFVVLGLVLIWIGIGLHWNWTRNVWFRIGHLLAITVVVIQSLLKITCPLTTWENALRNRAGQAPYGEQGFIEHWLHSLIFVHAPPWAFTLSYTLFGLAVLGTLILAPPRRERGLVSLADQARLQSEPYKAS